MWFIANEQTYRLIVVIATAHRHPQHQRCHKASLILLRLCASHTMHYRRLYSHSSFHSFAVRGRKFLEKRTWWNCCRVGRLRKEVAGISQNNPRSTAHSKCGRMCIAKLHLYAAPNTPTELRLRGSRRFEFFYISGTQVNSLYNSRDCYSPLHLMMYSTLMRKYA